MSERCVSGFEIGVYVINSSKLKLSLQLGLRAKPSCGSFSIQPRLRLDVLFEIRFEEGQTYRFREASSVRSTAQSAYLSSKETWVAPSMMRRYLPPRELRSKGITLVLTSPNCPPGRSGAERSRVPVICIAACLRRSNSRRLGHSSHFRPGPIWVQRI